MRQRLVVLFTSALAAASVSATVLVAAPAAAESQAAPVVGECHDRTFAQAAKASDSSAPVDCTTRHTLMTIAVGTIPETVWDKGREKRIAYASSICTDARDAYFPVGRRALATTLYASAFYFFPDAGQVAAGERFVRCDVAKRAGSKLFPLPADPRFTKVTKQQERCMTARFDFTPCTSAHRYRPTSTVALPRRRPAPGAEGRVVARRCLRSTGRPVPAVSWPGGSWRHDNLGVCYRRD